MLLEDSEFPFAECHRVLKPGGALIFTDPFNWTEPWLRERYHDSASILHLMQQTGFTLETWFDNLYYREILDARGSIDEFRALAVKATR